MPTGMLRHYNNIQILGKQRLSEVCMMWSVQHRCALYRLKWHLSCPELTIPITDCDCCLVTRHWLEGKVTFPQQHLATRIIIGGLVVGKTYKTTLPYTHSVKIFNRAHNAIPHKLWRLQHTRSIEQDRNNKTSCLH